MKNIETMTENELQDFIKTAQEQLLLRVRERVESMGLLYANDLSPEVQA